MSSGDNSNIISARVARETFGVENVVARIYDPRRAEVYSRLGIPTVATVRWTADQMLRRLLPDGGHSLWSDPTGHLLLVEVAYHVGWVGRSVGEIQAAATGTRGSPSSPGTARRSCRPATPRCRTATSST